MIIIIIIMMAMRLLPSSPPRRPSVSCCRVVVCCVLVLQWMPDYVRIVDLLRSIYDPSFIPPHLQSPPPTCWFCM